MCHAKAGNDMLCLCKGSCHWASVHLRPISCCKVFCANGFSLHGSDLQVQVRRLDKVSPKTAASGRDTMTAPLLSSSSLHDLQPAGKVQRCYNTFPGSLCCEDDRLKASDPAPVLHQLLRHALSNDIFCKLCYAGVVPTTTSRSLRKLCRSICAAQSMQLIAALGAH